LCGNVSTDDSWFGHDNDFGIGLLFGMSDGLRSEVGFVAVGGHVAAMPYCGRTGRDGRSTLV
jgi:hypothetical protein